MEQKLRHWLELGMRAPSGDNCQPWIIQSSENYLILSIDEKVANHFLDQNFAASWISVAAFCENLIQSAESFGFTCNIELQTDKTVKITYDKITVKENPLVLSAIKNRAVYREALNKVNFNVSDVLTTNKHKWNQKDSISSELLDGWSEMEALLWLKTSLMRDFTKWVRVSKKNIVDGLTLENLMLNIFDIVSVLTLKFIPFFTKLTPLWFFKITTKKRLHYLLTNSSGIIYLSGKFRTIEDYFLAGREIQSMWLQLTQKGIKAQPMAVESLYFNYLENPINEKYLSFSGSSKISVG